MNRLPGFQILLVTTSLFSGILSNRIPSGPALAGCRRSSTENGFARLCPKGKAINDLISKVTIGYFRPDLILVRIPRFFSTLRLRHRQRSDLVYSVQDKTEFTGPAYSPAPSSSRTPGSSYDRHHRLLYAGSRLSRKIPQPPAGGLAHA